MNITQPEIQIIIELFESFEKSKDNSLCSEMFCSTCGGLAFYIQQHLSPEDNSHITDILDRIDPNKIYQFGKWRPIIRSLFASKYKSLIEQTTKLEFEALNIKSQRSVNHFLFDAWKNKALDFDAHCRVIESGIELAVRRKNVSLVETLILILGDLAISYPDLVAVAVDLSNKNRQIKRVLYNKLREQLVEVRDYKGDGNTIFW